MKQVFFILFFFSFLFVSCDIRKREQILTQKENELNQKEQELILKEKALQSREEELLKRTQGADSINNIIATDSVFYNPEFVGIWSVRMNCIETSCPGSAVGDLKTEQWDISYQGNQTIAKVMDNAKVVRIYSGNSTSNSIEMTFQQKNSETNQFTNIIVRLEQTEKNRLEGKREITRAPENCKTIFAVEMIKQ